MRIRHLRHHRPLRTGPRGFILLAIACLLAAAAVGLRSENGGPQVRGTPTVNAAPLAASADTGRALAPLVLGDRASTRCDAQRDRPDVTTVLEGERIAWYPLTLRFSGPAAQAAQNDPNPFLDYRLTVRFVSPSGRAYDVPGFFAGDGRGGNWGDQWAARFSADEAGRWRYCASFRAGQDVAVDLDPLAGEAAAFDIAVGVFDIAPADPDAPGLLRWGRLDYMGGHYLKYRNGPYRLKGGTNSPENFLAYFGFRNTADQGGTLPNFLHTYAPHVRDWRSGDPQLAGAPDQGRGIIGALNYLGDQGVNSIHFLPMNLGGDGDDTYPFLAPSDTVHYDIGKLEQWTTVLQHAQRRGIGLHLSLAEAEIENRNWLGAGLSVQRRLFYRELVARFSHLLAIKWDISEEIAFTYEEAIEFADYLRALDWASHPIAVHNPTEQELIFKQILGRPEFSATSVQYSPNHVNRLVEGLRAASVEAGRPWVVEMDENNPAAEGLSPWNTPLLRKVILYDTYLSGGHIEWYLGFHEPPTGGDLDLEDFRTRDAMWDAMRYARRLLEDYTPFPLMQPADQLLAGEIDLYGGGEVLALPGAVYVIFLPDAGSAAASLAVPDGQYVLQWYDPRTGRFAGAPQNRTAQDSAIALGLPPEHPEEDWALLVTAVDYASPTLSPYP